MNDSGNKLKTSTVENQHYHIYIMFNTSYHGVCMLRAISARGCVIDIACSIIYIYSDVANTNEKRILDVGITYTNKSEDSEHIFIYLLFEIEWHNMA